MNPAPAAPWRRLAPLVLPVLAVHLALLTHAPSRMQAGAQRPVRFVTRSVVPPAAAPAPAPASTSAIAPAPAAPARAVIARAPAPAPARVQRRSPSATPATTATAPAPTPAAAALAAESPATPAPAIPEPNVTSPPVLAIPAAARLHYEVEVQARGQTLRGQAHLQWQHDGQAYEASLEASVAGHPARSQRSVGQITAQGLAPGYFADKGRGEQATHFDREHARLVFSNNRPQAPLAAGMQDRLSVLMQLSALVAGAPGRFLPGAQVAVPTASAREAQTWIFDVEGEEDLRLPGGEVRALKLQKLPRGPWEQRIELWLAPHMDYAPVRLRLTNPDGGAVDQRWASTDKG